MYMQALNRYSFSSIAVVSFALCLAAELKKTKKDDLILDGKLCYLPRSSSFELGIAAVICLSITQVSGSLFIYRKFRPREKRGKFIVTRSLLLLSWIGFGVAVILLSAASSMNQNQAFGEGWLDGECYLVKDGVYVGSAILTLVALGSTLGSGIVAVRRDKAEETQGKVNEKGENISWKAIGYCRPDFKHEERSKLEPLRRGVIELGRDKDAAIRALQKSGFPVAVPPPKSTTTTPSLVIKCDVVVVGSGAGGGVVAGVLAKAGYKVLVLEKGSYVPRNELSLLEGEAMDEMYLGHGALATENMDVIILAGSTVGGGTTINWSAAIRTPPHVRKDWSQNHGLELFGSKMYDNALDVVCERMGVQSEFEEEGFNNMVLRRGCENLGYDVETIPRNAPPDHYCGSCCLGCKDGKKKGVTETWLADLVESGNGKLLPGCEATEVVITRRNGARRASGVAFAFGGARETAFVEARATVVACGAICTPPLLRRSGLRNASIGRNLHLHPVVMGWGHFPDGAWPEAAKRSYEGPIMTAMTRVVADHEGSGYGTIIQTPALHPGMFSAVTPWRSGGDIKTRLLKFSRTVHIFALARDRGSGAVTSPDRISYKMEGCDEENLSRGLERVLRILAAAGAEEVGTQHTQGKVMKVKGASAEEVERFVKEESARPLRKLASPICSAHQMGSCRMGVDPSESAVGPTGETWEVAGLYVADSSVFPTALGVNPMVTVQAIAYCTAQSMLEALAMNVNVNV